MEALQHSSVPNTKETEYVLYEASNVFTEIG